MNESFDIYDDFLSGLTGYTFDISVLKRVALECGVAEVTEYSELTEEQKAERQKRFQEMKAKREAYVNELKSILSEEQLKQFNADSQKMQGRQHYNKK